MAHNASKTAFITGGASGIGLALTTRLLSEGWYVFVADRDITKLQDTDNLRAVQCDTSSWDSQVAAFRRAIYWRASGGGRIDFVAPIAGIGERKWLPFPEEGSAANPQEFTKPDLSVLDVDLTGVLYTVALALQHFRRHTRTKDGLLGRIGLVASVCGLYCVPSLPIYTAAKHALIGLTRSYGKLVVDEGITINAIAPNVVQTSISSPVFYEKLAKENLLTPMDGLVDALKTMLESNCSGEVFECGPAGGWTKREATEYLDKRSEEICNLLNVRARPLHYTS
ncbi:NAD(P)-binding protein [Macroventuria anomochaeta]|uniref:NAD(P)-binding protein n=1 Tax=Macroventuria anomochaeta TaxID=301207 RepID=A0ACB6RRH8_9PLEO|nr:NAD(P)-binding protein [Macroventuria anomochaeta]KAF2624651.1 NAD(P)-binding protein [Macroventuria anomochaeta]